MNPDVITKIVTLGKDAQSQHVGGRPPSPEETVKRLVDIAFDVSPDLLQLETAKRLAPVVSTSFEPADEASVPEHREIDEDEVPPVLAVPAKKKGKAKAAK